MARVTLADIIIDGTGVPTDLTGNLGPALLLYNCNDPRIDGITVRDFTRGAAFTTYVCWHGEFDGIKVKNSGGWGSAPAINLSDCYGTYVEHPGIEGATSNGLDINKCGRVTVSMPVINGPWGRAVKFDGSCDCLIDVPDISYGGLGNSVDANNLAFTAGSSWNTVRGGAITNAVGSNVWCNGGFCFGNVIDGTLLSGATVADISVSANDLDNEFINLDPVTASFVIAAGTRTRVSFKDQFDAINLTTMATITADQNNYNPTGGSTAGGWRISSDADRTITGIAAPYRGRLLPIFNYGGFNITLENEGPSSSTANRMAIGASIVLTPNTGVILYYDDDSSRWRSLGGAGGGMTVGSTVISGGLSGRIPYNNGGILGEYTEAAFKAAYNLEAGTDFYSISAANAAFQPIDADLTSWAAVTRGSGFDTFAATPSSANLASLVTGETGSGALVFGTSPGFTTDIRPVSNDGASLGISGTAFSDLFLASGAVINFNAGNVTWTHSAGKVAMTGNIDLDMSVASSTGVIYKGGSRWLHNAHPVSPNTSSNNIFLGINAGSLAGAMTNTGGNHEASYNIGIGGGALASLTSGYNNVAIGGNAMISAVSGYGNMAMGQNAGLGITSGYENMCIGAGAGTAVTQGFRNIFIGANAGANVTTGDRNIIFGPYNAASATGDDQLNIGDAIVGSTAANGVIGFTQGTISVKSYTVAGVPSAATAGQITYISNETGGAVLAFADGTNWRRVTDRAIIA